MELDKNILIEIEKELRELKVKKYVDTIKSQGWEALVYECLENMYYRGKFVMPYTYEHKEELIAWYNEHISYRMKCWRNV